MLAAPKDLRKNALFRRELLNACNSSTGEELRNEVIARCAADPVFFFDAFCWTYSPKDSADRPDVPFITYGFQEDCVLKLEAAFGHHSLLFEKSRDMGLSWITTTAILRRWLFYPRQSFLLGSRKQEFVDKTGDPKTLFWKLRYQLNMLPLFLKPPGELIEDNTLHIGNLVNGSTIDGESTNTDFGRGDRRTAILLDEFAAVENGNEVLAATRDATNCRLFVSTPQGCTGSFYDMRQTMLANNPERVVRLHWSQHPEKARGLYRASE